MLLVLVALSMLLIGGALACRIETALDRGEQPGKVGKTIPGLLLLGGFTLLGLMLSRAIHPPHFSPASTVAVPTSDRNYFSDPAEPATFSSLFPSHENGKGRARCGMNYCGDD